MWISVCAIHFALTYLLMFNFYTEATHKNHSLRMMATWIQFAPLFYLFKHPKYQVLHLSDLFEKAQMPGKTRSYICGISWKLLPIRFTTRGQGGDFVQEESNKLIKLVLPPCVPSQRIWTHVCRKAETLKELKTLVCKVRNVNLKYKGHLNEETMIYQAKVDKFTICFKKWFKISWWHCLRLWFDKLEIQCQCKLQ